MKRFLRNILLFLLPGIPLIGTYLWLDPFKVVHHYDCYYSPDDIVAINRGMVSTQTYLQLCDSAGYDSFIFGNSRSLYFETAAWAQYLPAGAKPFHFDASSESLGGVLKKVRLIDKHGAHIRNVLIVCDFGLLQQMTADDSHLFAEPPVLNDGNNALNFHLTHFCSFLNPKFLFALADYNLNHNYRQYMSELIEECHYSYELSTNELLQPARETAIEAGEYYNSRRTTEFDNVQCPDSVSPVALKAEGLKALHEMNDIFRRHSSDVHIVISPLYNQIRLNSADLDTLRQIFGTAHVHDFSGVNEWSTDYHNYYERSHYRPHVARAVMRRIYSPDAKQ